MRIFTTITIILVFNLGSTLFSSTKDDDDKNEASESTIASLLIGLNSDNIGLKSSSAYMLGELKVSSAVVALMKVLHNDENVEVRISAALALYKIGTPMAIYAVKQAIRFDDSMRVRKLAQKFYYDYARADLNRINQDKREKDIAQSE